MKTQYALEEKMLIEVFGCGSVDKRIIEAFPGKERRVVHSDFYHEGNGLEMALIETFGCISLDKVINLDINREMKRARLPVMIEDPTTMVVGLA